MFIIEERKRNPEGEILQQYQVLGVGRYDTACREVQRNAYDYLKEDRWNPVHIGIDAFELIDDNGYKLEQVIINTTERQ